MEENLYAKNQLDLTEFLTELTISSTVLDCLLN